MAIVCPLPVLHIRIKHDIFTVMKISCLRRNKINANAVYANEGLLKSVIPQLRLESSSRP
jgi:uncharacterized protein YqiB (DUF1249 family)